MSLYSDLNEVLTPYAQRIKGLAVANNELKADLGALTEPQRLADGTDLNTVLTPGVYMLHTANSYINKPTSDSEHGILEVWHEDYGNNAGRIFQRLTYTYKAGRSSSDTWTRTYSTFSSSWNDWIGNGLSDDIKEAIVNCFKKVSWSNETDGEGLMNALEVALGITPSQRRVDLPSAYEQVAYIYGIGGQYINTGIKSQIPLEIQCEAGKGANAPSIGAYNPSDAASRFMPFGIIGVNNKGRFCCRYANDTITVPGGASDSQWLYSVNFKPVTGEVYAVTSGIKSSTNSNKAITYIDAGGTRVEVERAKPSLGNDILLFNIPQGSTNSQLKLGYFKVYSGNTLLADYIPCYRKSDSVAGFYDVVSGAFKVNQGTGSFTVGDIVK